MGRPKDYKDGYVGVTTIVDVLEKDWMFWWFYSKGLKECIYTFLKEPKITSQLFRDFVGFLKGYIECDTTKVNSQKLGHGVHKGIEKFLRGYAFSKACEGLDNQQRVMLSKLTEWVGLEEFKAILVEKPLYSKKYKFAGTPDAIGTLNGGKTLVIVDWKTDSTPKPGQQTRAREAKYRFQAAGYSLLYSENYDVEIGKAIIVRITKDLPVPILKVIPIGNIKSARHKFLALRRIYKDVKGK